MNPQERSELIALALAETLSPEQAARLLAECRRDPQLLEELSRLTVTERLLTYLHLYDDSETFVREVRERLRSAPAPGSRSPQPSRPRSWWPFAGWRPVWGQPAWHWAAAAALVLLVGALGVTLWQPARAGAVNARVVRAEALAQAPGQALLQPGQVLPARRVQLDSGLLELRFDSGATVIVEGPADFEAASPLRGVLHRGKVVARVPEAAHGFTIEGPRGRLVDLGTEFGVNVSPAGDTEVHVLQGRVEAFPTGKRHAVELVENQALRLTAQTNQALPADTTAFITDLPPKAPGAIGYIHWAFDEGLGNTSSSTGQGFGSKPAPAHLLSFRNRSEGPKWVPGQFGNGLSFNGWGDYVECEYAGIGGEEPRTVAFWVKVPQNFKPLQGDAIIKWGTFAHQGGVWRVSINGVTNPPAWAGPLGLLRVDVQGGYVMGTTDLRDDRWHHCAVVMYGGHRPNTGRHVLLYVDGQLEPSARKKVHTISTDIQDATAHNVWIGRNVLFPENRQLSPDGPFFRGCVDEVYILDAALTQQQILSLLKYNRLGTPPKAVAAAGLGQ